MCVFVYLLQVDLSAVNHSCDVREAKSLLQVLQLLLQRADLLVAAQQVRFHHVRENLREKERRGFERTASLAHAAT